VVDCVVHPPATTGSTAPSRPTAVAVIPARYASTRLPGKPLVDLGGLPMIVRVVEQARRTPGIAAVVVATDDTRVRDAVVAHGGTAVMTRDDHPSGTDRLAEVARSLDCDVIVNVQGDEPLIDPAMIAQALVPFAEPAIEMTTLCRRFTDVEVASVEVTTVSDGNHLGHSTTFLQLYLAAVAAGIAAAVRTDAVDYVRLRARPAAHSLAAKAAGDPFVLHAVGEIGTAAAAAEALVLAAADVLDALVDAGAQSDTDALAQAAVAMAQAQLAAERLTLDSAQRLFDTGGASATSRKLNLDRHWRNVRTVASHNPLDYKAHAVGNYLVNGTTPPANGYF